MTLLSGNGGDGGDSGGTGSGGSGDPGASGGGAGGNQGAGGSASWRDSLPDDIKNDPSIANFNDVASLTKSYISTKAHVRKKGVIVPGQKATPEEWATFYREIGLPDPDKYDIKSPEGADANLITKFKEIAHKAGMLPRQAQEILDWFWKHETDTMASRKAEYDRSRKDGIEALRKEWAQGWDKQVAFARQGVSHVGGEEFQKYLETTGLGDDPQIIRMMAKVGALLGEDRLRGDGGGGRMDGMTPAEAQKQIETIMGNPNHPYFNTSHPGHGTAVREMGELFKASTPSKTA